MINWKVRLKNPVWWAQVAVAVAAPVLSYMGITATELTTWAEVGKVFLSAAGNPYVVGLVLISVWHTINDPTTSGLKDSTRAMKYSEPFKDEQNGQPVSGKDR